jgi:hypothetical protein
MRDNIVTSTDWRVGSPPEGYAYPLGYFASEEGFTAGPTFKLFVTNLTDITAGDEAEYVLGIHLVGVFSILGRSALFVASNFSAGDEAEDVGPLGVICWS